MSYFFPAFALNQGYTDERIATQQELHRGLNAGIKINVKRQSLDWKKKNKPGHRYDRVIVFTLKNEYYCLTTFMVSTVTPFRSATII